MGWLKDNNPWAMLGFSAALIGGVYVLKYSTLKFTGWITGLNEAPIPIYLSSFSLIRSSVFPLGAVYCDRLRFRIRL